MNTAPRWFVPVAVVALIWNLLGCAAYLYEVTLSPEALAQLTEAQKAVYEARPSWTVAATAVAVWFGALGCVGLILRKRWAFPVLCLSLLGVVAQDIALIMIGNAVGGLGATVYVMQGLVLVIAIGLVFLSRKALQQEWLT